LKWTLKEVYYLEKQCAAKYFTQAGFVSIVRHVLEQFLKMRILEPEDGGGVESQECGLHQNKLLSTKLESSNKLKHKNINPFGFPLWQRADKINIQ
jgi:hypothetical protein